MKYLVRVHKWSSRTNYVEHKWSGPFIIIIIIITSNDDPKPSTVLSEQSPTELIAID